MARKASMQEMFTGLLTAVEVGHAAGGVARAGPAQRARDGDDGEVVPVDEAHVVEVLAAARPQRDLEERGRWRGAGAAALHAPAAVAGLAHPGSGRVEHAPGPRPHSPRPTRRRREPHRLPRPELEPRRGQLRRAGAGQRPRPYRVGAVVRYGECRRGRTRRSVQPRSQCQHEEP